MVREAHKVVDGLPALLVSEAGFVIGSHDSLPSPLPNLPAKICLPTLAHFALSAEGLQGQESVPALYQLQRASWIPGRDFELLLHRKFDLEYCFILKD